VPGHPLSAATRRRRPEAPRGARTQVPLEYLQSAVRSTPQPAEAVDRPQMSAPVEHMRAMASPAVHCRLPARRSSKRWALVAPLARTRGAARAGTWFAELEHTRKHCPRPAAQAACPTLPIRALWVSRTILRSARKWRISTALSAARTARIARWFWRTMPAQLFAMFQCRARWPTLSSRICAALPPPTAEGAPNRQPSSVSVWFLPA